MTVHADVAAHLQAAFEKGRTDWAQLAHEVEVLAVPVLADLAPIRRRLMTLDNAILLARSVRRRRAEAGGSRRFDQHVAYSALACAGDVRKLLARPDLVDMIRTQIKWSAETFGPGVRTDGVLAHIRKELIEVEADPHDVTEWIDVVILALDGAWRHAPSTLSPGRMAELIVSTLEAKYAKNRARTWPDWRTAEPGAPIEHVRNEAGL